MGKRDRRKCLSHIAFIKILVVVTARNWGQVDEEMGFCIIRIQEYLKDSKHKDVAGHWMQTRTRGTYRTRKSPFSNSVSVSSFSHPQRLAFPVS